MRLLFTFNRYHRWLLYWGWDRPFVHACDISKSSQSTDWRSGGQFGAFGEAGQTRWGGQRGRCLSLTVSGETCGCWLQEDSGGFGFSTLSLWPKSNEISRWRMTWGRRPLQEDIIAEWLLDRKTSRRKEGVDTYLMVLQRWGASGLWALDDSWWPHTTQCRSTH